MSDKKFLLNTSSNLSLNDDNDNENKKQTSTIRYG